MPAEREILTAEQLAERWQVPKSWVYEKTRTKEIPSIPLPGKYRRYRLDAIEEFERREFPSASGSDSRDDRASKSNGRAALERPRPGTGK